MDIGLRLKQFRILLGLNQEDFVKGIMSESYYSRVERGKGSLEIMQLMAILNKNKISLRDFFEEDERTDYFKELAQIKLAQNGKLTREYLLSVKQLFPFLDNAEKEKLMDAILQVPASTYQDNLSLVNESSQVVMNYLADCWENDNRIGVEKSVQYLRTFKVGSLSKYKVLLLDYFEAWAQNDNHNIKLTMEKIRKNYEKDILKEKKK